MVPSDCEPTMMAKAEVWDSMWQLSVQVGATALPRVRFIRSVLRHLCWIFLFHPNWHLVVGTISQSRQLLRAV